MFFCLADHVRKTVLCHEIIIIIKYSEVGRAKSFLSMETNESNVHGFHIGQVSIYLGIG